MADPPWISNGRQTPPWISNGRQTPHGYQMGGRPPLDIKWVADPPPGYQMGGRAPPPGYQMGQREIHSQGGATGSSPSNQQEDEATFVLTIENCNLGRS